MPAQNEELRHKRFPCPLCETDLDIRLDEKHGKPYVICNSCGVQMFVRRDRGAELMLKKATWGVLSVLFR